MFGKVKVEKVRSLGEKDMKKLMEYAKNQDPQVKIAVAQVLGRINNEDSYNTLIGLLADDNVDVKSAAVHSLVFVTWEPSLNDVRYEMSKATDPAFVEVCKEAINKMMKVHR